jgi:biotin carboxylase
MKRVLLLLPTTSYRNDDFRDAARKIGIEIVAATNYCHKLAPDWGMAPIMSLQFDQPHAAADTVLSSIAGALDGVLAVDDAGVELAALLCERLGLSGNPPAAVRLLRDKQLFRDLLAGSNIKHPQFRPLPTGTDPHSLLPDLSFPLVVKARRLSGSCGVIRADNADELAEAVSRVRAIQARSDRDAAELGIVVEEFIPGMEFALEGILTEGELTTLALFDKPDPLDGPYFEETLYVTPSRLSPAVQGQIEDTVTAACRAAGLVTGPIHAEMRVNAEGVWLLEVASRSIGGLCGRMLRHSLGISLEELILRHLVGEPLPNAVAGDAAGVMMIPIPRRGIYDGVHGLDAAQAVPGVTGVNITAEKGQIVSPPPAGSSYLGFIFSRATNPAEAEAALRVAHQCLRFDIRTEFTAVAR